MKSNGLKVAHVVADDGFGTKQVSAVLTGRHGSRSVGSVESDARAFTVMRQAGIWGGGAGCSASGVGSLGFALVALLIARRRASGR